MPALLVIVGLVLVIAAVRNTLGSLAGHLQQDLGSGQGGGSFWTWAAAIILIGMIGYIPNLQGLSRALLALVVLVVLLKRGSGLVDQFRTQLNTPPAEQAQPAAPPNLGPLPITLDLAGGQGGAGSAIKLQPSQDKGSGSFLGSVFGGAIK